MVEITQGDYVFLNGAISKLNRIIMYDGSLDYAPSPRFYDSTKRLFFKLADIGFFEYFAGLPLTLHALHYGTGDFEGIREYMTRKGRVILALNEHVERLNRSSEMVDLARDGIIGGKWNVVVEPNASALLKNIRVATAQLSEETKTRIRALRPGKRTMISENGREFIGWKDIEGKAGIEWLDPRTYSLSTEEIKVMLRFLASLNKFEEAYLRPIVVKGNGGLGVLYDKNVPLIGVIVQHWGQYVANTRAFLSRIHRPDPCQMPTEGKLTGPYVYGAMAKSEAVKHGCAEPLMLDSKGRLSEFSGADLMLVNKGVGFTPPDGPQGSGQLPSITRNILMQRVAPDIGLEVRSRHVTLKDMQRADKMLALGTAAEISEINEVIVELNYYRELEEQGLVYPLKGELSSRRAAKASMLVPPSKENGRITKEVVQIRVSDGKPNPLVERCMGEFGRLARGENPRHLDLLTPVDGPDVRDMVRVYREAGRKRAQVIRAQVRNIVRTGKSPVLSKG